MDVAVLEAARGGILRRGLGVESCEAALVTNVANDNLGDYGIHTVPQMAQAKGVVYDVVSPDAFVSSMVMTKTPDSWGKPSPAIKSFSVFTVKQHSLKNDNKWEMRCLC